MLVEDDFLENKLAMQNVYGQKSTISSFKSCLLSEINASSADNSPQGCLGELSMDIMNLF